MNLLPLPELFSIVNLKYRILFNISKTSIRPNQKMRDNRYLWIILRDNHFLPQTRSKPSLNIIVFLHILSFSKKIIFFFNQLNNQNREEEENYSPYDKQKPY